MVLGSDYKIRDFEPVGIITSEAIMTLRVLNMLKETELRDEPILFSTFTCLMLTRNDDMLEIREIIKKDFHIDLDDKSLKAQQVKRNLDSLLREPLLGGSSLLSWCLDVKKYVEVEVINEVTTSDGIKMTGTHFPLVKQPGFSSDKLLRPEHNIPESTRKSIYEGTYLSNKKEISKLSLEEKFNYFKENIFLPHRADVSDAPEEKKEGERKEEKSDSRDSRTYLEQYLIKEMNKLHHKSDLTMLESAAVDGNRADVYRTSDKIRKKNYSDFFGGNYKENIEETKEGIMRHVEGEISSIELELMALGALTSMLHEELVGIRERSARLKQEMSRLDRDEFDPESRIYIMLRNNPEAHTAHVKMKKTKAKQISFLEKQLKTKGKLRGKLLDCKILIGFLELSAEKIDIYNVEEEEKIQKVLEADVRPQRIITHSKKLPRKEVAQLKYDRMVRLGFKKELVESDEAKYMMQEKAKAEEAISSGGEEEKNALDDINKIIKKKIDYKIWEMDPETGVIKKITWVKSQAITQGPTPTSHAAAISAIPGLETSPLASHRQDEREDAEQKRERKFASRDLSEYREDAPWEGLPGATKAPETPELGGEMKELGGDSTQLITKPITSIVWSQEIAYLMMDLLVYYPGEIHFSVGIMLFLTNACKIRGELVPDLQEKFHKNMFFIAHRCLLNGNFPFVYNPNGHHFISPKNDEFPSVSKWCNLYSLFEESEDYLESYYCVMPATMRLSTRLNILSREHHDPNIESLCLVEQDSILKHPNKTTKAEQLEKTKYKFWKKSGFSCVSGLKLGLSSKSHCRLCGGIYNKKQEGFSYLTTEELNEKIDKRDENDYIKIDAERLRMRIETLTDSIKNQSEETELKLCRLCMENINTGILDIMIYEESIVLDELEELTREKKVNEYKEEDDSDDDEPLEEVKGGEVLHFGSEETVAPEEIIMFPGSSRAEMNKEAKLEEQRRKFLEVCSDKVVSADIIEKWGRGELSEDEEEEATRIARHELASRLQGAVELFGHTILRKLEVLINSDELEEADLIYIYDWHNDFCKKIKIFLDSGGDLKKMYELGSTSTSGTKEASKIKIFARRKQREDAGERERRRKRLEEYKAFKERSDAEAAAKVRAEAAGSE